MKRKSCLPSLLLIFLVAATPALAQKKSGKIVTLHVQFVDQAGNRLSGIQPEEIQVLEGGRLQENLQVIGPDTPFDVGLLLDVSPSAHQNVDAIRRDTHAFFTALPFQTEALILTFDAEVYVDCDWTTDRKKVEEAIFEIGLHKPGSKSKIYDALDLTLDLKYVERGPRHTLILFSDGMENSSKLSEKKAIEEVRKAGILTYAIQYDSRPYYRRLYGGPHYDPRRSTDIPGSGTDVGGIYVGSGRNERDMAEYKVQTKYKNASKRMKSLGDAGRGEYFQMANWSDLPDIYGRILDQLEGVFTIRYLSQQQPDRRFHSVRVATTRPDVTVRQITKGYWAY